MAGSSLVAVGDSSLPVAWGFLSSCSILVSSKVSGWLYSSCGGGFSPAVMWLLLCSGGVLVGYSLVLVCALLSSYGVGLFSCSI